VMSSGHKESEQLFFLGGWRRKKNVNRFFSYKKNTVDINFFFMATRFNF